MSGDSTPSTVIYKDVPSFPGYQVGDDGSVWTFWNRNWRFPRTIGDIPKRMKTTLCDGYPTVCLTRNGKEFSCRVHRLVLEAFVGPCPAGHECAHDNGIRSDCRLSNLAWKTKKANQDDKRRHGTMVCGERHSRAKLTAAQVLEIRAKQGIETRQLLADKYGVGLSAIKKIFARKNWNHV